MPMSGQSFALLFRQYPNLRQNKELVFVSFKKGFDKDISPILKIIRDGVILSKVLDPSGPIDPAFNTYEKFLIFQILITISKTVTNRGTLRINFGPFGCCRPSK